MGPLTMAQVGIYQIPNTFDAIPIRELGNRMLITTSRSGRTQARKYS